MQKKIKLICSFLVLLLIGGEAYCKPPLNNKGLSKRLTIVFTSDIHSSALARSAAYSTKTKDSIAIVGGYTRLATQIDRERKDAAGRGDAFICIDAGDIAMGTVFHSLYSSHAFELRSMAKMGYDAICLGNHDYDLGLDKLVQMYTVAYSAENKLPLLLCANISYNNIPALQEIIKKIGFASYTILERNGLKIGIMGVMGSGAYSSITDKSGIVYTPAKEALKPIVKILKSLNVDYIVLLSHSGSFNAKSLQKSEDAVLAKQIPDIDVIISGHDHFELQKPLHIGNTVIGNVGANGLYLGKINISKDTSNANNKYNYKLIPIVDTIEQSAQMKNWVDSIKNIVAEKIHKGFGVNLFDTVSFISKNYNLLLDKNGNLALGSLIAKSYKRAVIENVSGIKEEDLVAVVPYGTIRNKLAPSVITYNDVFNVLSLGMDANDRVGYPLVLTYLNGKELKDLCELNASIAPNFMDAQLLFDGLYFEYNSYKLPFTKVCELMVGGKKVENKKLYPVVSGMYTAKLLGLLKSESFGLLKANLKDKNGKAFNNLEDMLIYTKDNMPMSEWIAFANCLKTNNIDKLDKSNLICAKDRHNKIIIIWYAIALAIIILPISIYIGRKIKRGKKKKSS